MSRKSAPLAVLIAVVLTLALAGAAVAKGPPQGGETAVNNLSFPAITADGFAIPVVVDTHFDSEYAGEYPGLTAAEIAALEATGPWYPQKLGENKWQADSAPAAGVEDVGFVDWSDNIESVNPKVNRPFRLEVVLFEKLTTPMTAYTMAVLEYPSSSDELQGTNAETYESEYATIVSARPQLVVQYYGDSVPADLTWSGTAWSSGTIVPVSFAPELNVGGKYVFGASAGGWKPDKPGFYRLTFYAPFSSPASNVNLATALVGNWADTFATAGVPGPGEAAHASIDAVNNLSYIDVQAVGGGGGGRRP